MAGYILTPLARADIFEIWSYLAGFSDNTADSVEQAVYDACLFIAKGPMFGHSRSELTTRSLRFWTLTRYPNYTVVYRPETVPLQVVAVLHGRRDLRRVLAQRPLKP